MKQATIALVVRNNPSTAERVGEPILLGVLSDDREIEVFERAMNARIGNPFLILQAHRERLAQEEDEFGNYVEELLTHPAINAEIREHGIQWFRSKIRIEQYQKAEREAVEIITGYALKIYAQDPEKTDFLLAGPTTHVRVRVFCLDGEIPASSVA